MKKIIIGVTCIIILIISFFLIKIPEYVELNNLIIVEGIGVECNKEYFKLYLKEVIPTKDDTGISYDYRIYDSGNSSSIANAYKKLEKKSKKKIFYKDVRYVMTNCTKSESILEYFDVNPNYIEHTKNEIKKELNKK